MILVKMNGEVYTLRSTIDHVNLRTTVAMIWLVNVATSTESRVDYSRTPRESVVPRDERVGDVVRVLRMAGAEVFGWDDEPIKVVTPPLEGYRKFNAEVAAMSEDALYENSPECPRCGKGDRDWSDGINAITGSVECEGCEREYAYTTKVCLMFESSEINEEDEYGGF